MRPLAKVWTWPLDEASIAARGLPWTIPGAWTLAELAEVALRLPRVAELDADRPVGLAVFPPQGAEPLVRLARATVDGGGHRIERGARGALGVLWHGRSDSSPVHRVWFAAHGRELHFVDLYADQIASVEALEVGAGALMPELPGWQVGLL